MLSWPSVLPSSATTVYRSYGRFVPVFTLIWILFWILKLWKSSYSVTSRAYLTFSELDFKLEVEGGKKSAKIVLKIRRKSFKNKFDKVILCFTERKRQRERNSNRHYTLLTVYRYYRYTVKNRALYFVDTKLT